MYKLALLLAGLFFIHGPSFAQAGNAKVIFVVDSIPVINDPEEGNEILQDDVADIVVLKNKDTLNRLGYGKFDGATLIFTKEYRKRPDSLKAIPSSKQLEKTNGVWQLHGSPYSGRFIDYYYSGRKEGEGTFVEGKIDGSRIMYYQNGTKKVDKIYKRGLENGLYSEYYNDGALRQKGNFADGKEEGIWEDYYPNGQVKFRSKYSNGELFDTATKYYSTGKIKEKVFIKDGKVVPDPHLAKLNQLLIKSEEANKEEDIRSAIKYCSKALELDSTFAQAYFSRGTLKLNDFQFEEAIVDFDKALQFEPFMEFALANRAFARIRKYQFANGRTLSKSREITVVASPDKVTIPANEQQIICSDLQKAVQLGDKNKMVLEALATYCSSDSSR